MFLHGSYIKRAMKHQCCMKLHQSFIYDQPNQAAKYEGARGLLRKHKM